MERQFGGLNMTDSSLPVAEQEGTGEKIKGDPGDLLIYPGVKPTFQRLS